jgi:hypothetical protein
MASLAVLVPLKTLTNRMMSRDGKLVALLGRLHSGGFWLFRYCVHINSLANEKSPQAANSLVDVDFWRRVWDSNPRAQ